MKRGVAILLSIILILNILPTNAIYAASIGRRSFKELTQELVANDGTLILDENSNVKEKEMATLQWDITDAGKYTLTYYTDTNTESGYRGTTRVEVVFQVDFDKIRYEIKAFRKNSSTQIGTTYTGTVSQTNPGTERYIMRNIGNLKININIDVANKVIQLGTNGINKGNFTEFELDYEGEKEYIGVLRGVGDITITPTHYEKDVANLEDSRKELTITEGDDGDIPGDRPGIKVEFQVPRALNYNTGEFELISDNNIKATLALFPELEPNATISGDSSAKFEFALGDSQPNIKFIGSALADKNSGVKKAIISADGKATVYLSKADDFTNKVIKQHIITWDSLNESMFVGGNITFSGLFDNDKYNKYSNYNEGLTFDVVTGVTYLNYDLVKTEEGKVAIEITPYKYKNQELYYFIYESDAGVIDTDKPFGVYQYKYTDENPNEKLMVTVPSDGENKFLIKISFSKLDPSKAFDSQKVTYDSTGIVSSPNASQIVDVNSIYVVPKEDNEKEIDAAGFDIQWSVPSKEELINTLRNGKLYYEISIDSNRESNEKEKNIIAILELTLKTDNNKEEIWYRIHGKKEIGNIEEATGNIEFTPGKSQNLIKLKKVILKTIDKAPKVWKYEGDYLKADKYLDNVKEKDLATDYIIPSTYYLRIKTILEPNVGTLKTNIYDTEPYAIALDKVTDVVPTPAEIQIGANDGSFTNYILKYGNVDLSSYVYHEVESRNQELVSEFNSIESVNLPRTYEIYLYQNNYIVQSAEGNKQTEVNELTESVLKKIQGTSKLVDVKSGVLNPNNKVLSLSEEELSELRKGNILRIQYHTGQSPKDIEIEINGLDTNQSYNVRINTKVIIQQRNNGKKVESSKLSEVKGFTTGTEAKPPTEDENIPPVPEEYSAKAEDSTTGVLYWDDPKGMSDKKLSYEIIRVTDQSLSKEVVEKGTKQDLKEFLASVNRKDAVTFKIDNLKKEYVEEKKKELYVYKDTTLAPNTIYYYYIRTVCDNGYSHWIYQPVTTKNIDKPEDLKVIDSTKNSIDIGFLAKVPLNTVPQLYDFEIVIQEDSEGEWIAVSSKTKLKETKEGIKEGYTYFEYQIGKLKPNKRYNIKVCLIDKSSGENLKSLYSNIVYTRTEYDQETQDQEDKYKEYLDKFDAQVEKLKNQSYWIVEDGVYKYRKEYLDAELSINSEYQLVSDENDSGVYYYIPISSIEAFNENKVIMKASIGDYSIDIRPNTLTTDNKTIAEAIDDVDTARIADYYIGIHFYKKSYSDKINNEETLSPKLTVDIEVVYLDKEDWEIEEQIMASLLEIISDKRERFIDKLESKVKKTHISESELQNLIDDIIEDIKMTHKKRVYKQIDKVIDKTLGINEIKKSILIEFDNKEDFALNGYFWNKGWISTEVYLNGSTAYIEASKLGAYIFTGQPSLLETVPSLAPYQKFISQYGLTEIFKLDSYTIKTAVTKKQVYSATAKVMGAPSGSDYIMYLQNKGVKGVASITQNKAIRQDEAIYIVMQAYEIQKNRPVQTINITNKQSVTNIGAFQPIYRDYVYAAVQLKVINNQDSKVLPSKQISVEEFIQILCKMLQK